MGSTQVAGWGLLPTRGKLLLVCLGGLPGGYMQLELPPERGMVNWGLYRGGGLLGCYLGWVPLSAEGHETQQVPGESPGWIPEERPPTLKMQTSLGKYLVSQAVLSSSKFTQVPPWCEAEPTAQSPEGLSTSHCRQS